MNSDITPAFDNLLLNTPDAELNLISAKILDGKRISISECLTLYEKGDLGFLGVLANFVQKTKNGNYTYFNRNFHIEPTNVCVFACKFCSYSMEYKNKEAGWELDMQQMLDKVKAYDG